MSKYTRVVLMLFLKLFVVVVVFCCFFAFFADVIIFVRVLIPETYLLASKTYQGTQNKVHHLLAISYLIFEVNILCHSMHYIK